MTKYNHMMDVAFTIETEEKDWTKIPADELIGALQRRIHYLQRNPEDADAFGHCDSYEIEEPEKPVDDGEAEDSGEDR